MMRLDERGKQCPLPVMEAKRALEAAPAGEVVEVVVDNEIAVQNLRKMAVHKGYQFEDEKVGEREYVTRISRPAGTAGDAKKLSGTAAESALGSAVAGGIAGAAQAVQAASGALGSPAEGQKAAGQPERDDEPACIPCQSQGSGLVVVLSSNCMGSGDEALGKILMKGFVYALAGQDILPDTVLLYNSGAFLSCEGSDSVEDLRTLEAQGVEILTCGTCLNHYGLTDKLQVGGVTNMYEITERMTGAVRLVRP